MQSSVWAMLLRHVPAEQHSNLMLVTSAGTEITLQSVLRIDHQFVAVKGRLAGSQEAGRVFFIPYNQIDYLGFQQPLKDTEFNAMFNNLPMLSPSGGQQPEGGAGPDPGGTGNRAGAPIKSTVLERFRNRSTSQGTTLRPNLDG